MARPAQLSGKEPGPPGGCPGSLGWAGGGLWGESQPRPGVCAPESPSRSGAWGGGPCRAWPGSRRLLSPAPYVSGEATWSGSESEVSFPDSPGTQAPQGALPQLTLPDSLASAAAPEDGLSAELLEAQAEDEPASLESLGPGAQAQLSAPE